MTDIKNDIRRKIWLQQPRKFKKEAIINADGRISPTWGECKQGMDISYNGKWGYNPLIISLANSRKALYIVNRPGNVASHDDTPFGVDNANDPQGAGMLFQSSIDDDMIPLFSWHSLPFSADWL